MSKFLEFKKIDEPSTGFEYAVNNKKGDGTIGYIFIYKPWKKWVFEPAYDEIVCDAECLRDIADFMEKLK